MGAIQQQATTDRDGTVNAYTNENGARPNTSTIRIVVLIFTALALWSSFSLTYRLLTTFRQYSGLYFWSILITTWALSTRAIGVFLMYNIPAISTGSLWPVAAVLFEVGWVGMVSGFAMVLYSRLSILVLGQRKRRIVLLMIVVGGIIMHGGSIFVLYTDFFPTRSQWFTAAGAIERSQTTWFTIQEGIITILYINAAWIHLQDPTATDGNQAAKRTMTSLITTQLFVIILDIAVLVIELAGYFAIKGIIFSFIYAIKLEIEFVVLNQLVAMSGARMEFGSRLVSSDDSGLRLQNAYDPLSWSTVSPRYDNVGLTSLSADRHQSRSVET